MGRKLFGLIVCVAFFYIASPFIFPVAMGAVIAVLFLPWLEKMEKKKMSTQLASALLTVGITVLLLLPSALMIFFVTRTAVVEVQGWRKLQNAQNSFSENLASIPAVHRFLEWISTHFSIDTQNFMDMAQDFAGGLGLKLTEFLGGIVTHIPGIVMAMVVVVVSVYFCLADGRKWVHFLRRTSVFTPTQTDRLLDTLRDTCRSVILAAVVSGGMQALTEALALILTGTPNATLFGLLVFAGSFVPVVGSSPLTFFIAIQQLLAGRQAAGITLLIVAFVITGIDNAIRPIFLKGSANLHPFLAFVAAFGGLQTLGFLGVFLGPIVAALFVGTLQILTEEEPRIEMPNS